MRANFRIRLRRSPLSIQRRRHRSHNGKIRSDTMKAMPADSGKARSPSKYDRLIAAAKAVRPAPTIVVHPCDETSLRGAVDSAAAGIIRPVLVGPERKIRDTASTHGLDISG